jgi:hypothetical protein
VLLRGLGGDRAAEILGADAGLIEPLLGSVHTGTTAMTVPVPADAGETLARAAQEAAAAIDAGAGPSGHELAGWTAYYQRRLAAALRFAERGHRDRPRHPRPVHGAGRPDPAFVGRAGGSAGSGRIRW